MKEENEEQKQIISWEFFFNYFAISSWLNNNDYDSESIQFDLKNNQNFIEKLLNDHNININNNNHLHHHSLNNLNKLILKIFNKIEMKQNAKMKYDPLNYINKLFKAILKKKFMR